ncbi:EscU/YscU/HrcU family type III secretion system export apparatus switch protein [Alteromonas facilis]|uniref:EscU/YscU/HrcU family type III secretion system export apparatus switch protein n=1 Tax=Alteromonas facilis TaxID=2048004 RepID=UPI000C291AD6|nr:EscU/YscU/HrcU family type III secretion system export apparatus switch protein [Alteromonas facilis]
MKKGSKAFKRAVGLKYNSAEKGAAPEVIAKGFGELAEEIIAVAKQNDVMIHEDRYLSEFLSTLDLGQEIPEQLYYVIAELIAFSYILQGKTPPSWKSNDPSIDVNA